MTQIPNLEPSEDLAYILGVINGDASVTKSDQKNGYFTRIIVHNSKRKEFNKSFGKALKNIGLRPIIKFNKQLNCFTLTCSNKFFVDWYLKQSFIDIKQFIEGFEVAFLRGFYESEGSYYFTQDKRKYPDNEGRIPFPYVSLTGGDKDIISYAYHIILGLSFNPRFNANKRSKTAFKEGIQYMIHLRRKGEAERFIRLINPCIKNLPSNMEAS